VVDTPGFRQFGIHGIPLQEIGRYYPEFRPHIPRCRYSDCLHVREPECAVQAALEAGEIPPLRFRNYLNILRAHRAPDLSPGERFRVEAEEAQGIDDDSV
jgi:ribosome biogenesis GTPase